MNPTRSEYLKLLRIRDSLSELVESVLDRFIEKDSSDEWTDQDTVFMQDVRDLYEELGDG